MKKDAVLIHSIDIKQRRLIFNAVSLFLGRIIAPWYPMVEKTANSMITEFRIFTNPKASGAYMRVRMGVSNMPAICEITGTDVSVSTSEANVPFLFSNLRLSFCI